MSAEAATKGSQDPAAVAPRLPRLLLRAGVMLLVGLALYVALSLWSGQQALAELGTLSLARWGLVLLLVCAGFGLRALRWHLYLRYLGVAVSLRDSVWVFFASFAMTATPGKAGEVVKSFLLKQSHGAPLLVTAAALLVERLTDLLAVLALSLAGLALPGAQPYFLAGALLLCAGFTLAASETLHRAVLLRLRRVRALAPACDNLLRLLAAGRRLLHGRPLLAGFTLAFVAWSCEAAALLSIALPLGVPLSPLRAATAFGLATLVGALSMLPGGLGGFEGTLLLLLGAQGATRAQAVAATLLLRAATLWFATLLGAAALLGWWLARRRERAALSSPLDRGGPA